MSHSFELVYQGTDDMTARYTYLADATKLKVVNDDGWGYDSLGSPDSLASTSIVPGHFPA